MLEIKNLSARRGSTAVFENLNLSLTPHTITAVIGKNGCGKSTLCECINQTLPYVGEILFSGRNISLMRPRERAAYISFLPQILTSPHITVRELIELGRSPYVDIGHRLTENDLEKCADAASCTGAFELLSKYVDELSGGERQRAYLAMTLAQDTQVTVLDEPTTYMDMAYESSFMNTLTHLRDKRKKTLLVIMHNINTAIRYADRIAVMDGGKLVFCGGTRECIECGVIEQVFGAERISSSDKIFSQLDFYF